MSGYAREIAFFGILLLSILSIVHAEIAPFRECPGVEPDTPKNCTIHEVRINPCKEAAQSRACRLKRGHDASIEFDYTPNFAATTLEGKAFWVNSVIEVPFLGMESNACIGTPCPVVANQKQTYRQDFPISKKYPIRQYDVKWVLENPGEPANACCFIFQIKIHK